MDYLSSVRGTKQIVVALVVAAIALYLLYSLHFFTEPARSNSVTLPMVTDVINRSFRHPITNKMIDSSTAKPLQFLPKYLNPCWYEDIRSDMKIYKGNFYLWHRRSRVHPYFKYMQNYFSQKSRKGQHKRLRCLPYFYIIGFSKCGTTDLFQSLLKHPRIEKHIPLKEPMFWNRRRYGRVANKADVLERSATFEDYVDLYDFSALQISHRYIEKNGKKRYNNVIVDGTPSYVWDYDAWRNTSGNTGLTAPRYIVADYIKHFTPNAKFIVIMREPVARLYSDYLYVNHGGESKENFHKAAEESIRQIEGCVQERTMRECMYDPELNLNMPLRMRLSHYFVFVRDWLSVFPKKSFFFTRLEDYAKNKSGVISKMAEFLGIGELSYEKAKQLSSKSSQINRKSSNDVKVGGMLPETKVLLRRYFESWNKKLADLIRDQAFLWST